MSTEKEDRILEEALASRDIKVDVRKKVMRSIYRYEERKSRRYSFLINILYFAVLAAFIISIPVMETLFRGLKPWFHLNGLDFDTTRNFAQGTFLVLSIGMATVKTGMAVLRRWQPEELI